MNRILTCDPGDRVIHHGKEMVVAVVITPGRETYMVKSKQKGRKIEQKGDRSGISAYPLAPDNGKIMTRSPRCIGQNWEHCK